MPTYDFKCPEGHVFEEFQRINDEPSTACPTCGKPSSRMIGAGSGLMFKGSGFYITDYKKTGASNGSNGEKKEKKADSGKKD
ncbi:zinc ribbon domain-containing protein [bacterium]|nr:zinc ribbon domain-containing protein [bacterium]